MAHHSFDKHFLSSGIFLLLILDSISEVNSYSVCDEDQRPDYCSFVTPLLAKCCESATSCNRSMMAFEWKKQTYLSYDRIYWPMLGITRSGQPMFQQMENNTKNVGDGFLRGYRGSFLYGWLTAAIEFKGQLIVFAKNSMSFATYAFALNKMDDKADVANKDMALKISALREDILNSQVVLSAFKAPFQSDNSSVIIFGFATDSSKKDTVTRLVSVDDDGMTKESKNGEFSTSSAIVYKNNPSKTTTDYLVFHNNGFVCFMNRNYSEASIIHDFPEDTNLRLQPNCFPAIAFFGCPQDFCYQNNVDDFIYNPKTKISKLFRGPYYWSSIVLSKEPPFPYPFINQSKVIDKNTPQYIDAAFSMIKNDKEIRYFFKDKDCFVSIDGSMSTKTSLKDFATDMEFVDAALFIEPANLLLLFAEEYIHVFTSNQGTVPSKWTPANIQLLAIAYNFTGIAANVDAILQIEDMAYVTKQNIYYTVNLTSWDTYLNKKTYTPHISFRGLVNDESGLFETPDSCFDTEKTKEDLAKQINKDHPTPAKETDRYRWKAKLLQSKDKDDMVYQDANQKGFELSSLLIPTIIIVVLLIFLLGLWVYFKKHDWERQKIGGQQQTVSVSSKDVPNKEVTGKDKSKTKSSKKVNKSKIAPKK